MKEQANSSISETYATQNGVLQLMAIDTEGLTRDFMRLNEIVREEVHVLAPYIVDPAQFLVVRDNAVLSIDGKYPAGHTYSPHESMVALPSWQNVSEIELRAVIAHELHHMARWQQVGYGETLGGALASEGIATYYEEIRTGRQPVWSQAEINRAVYELAEKEWESDSYNHQEWFFGGPHGRWVGYSLGYALAKRVLEPFSVKRSVEVRDGVFKRKLQNLQNQTPV